MDFFLEAVDLKLYPSLLCRAQFSLDLHNLSPGAAVLATRWWLAEILPSRLQSAQTPRFLLIITAWGKHRAEWQTKDVKEAVARLLEKLELPLLLTTNPEELRLDPCSIRKQCLDFMCKPDV